MSSKRPGWRSAERTYRSLTADLQRKANAERQTGAALLLREALHELAAMHSHHYATCEGECPADNIIKRGRAYLARFGMGTMYVGSCRECWSKVPNPSKAVPS